MPQQTSEPTRQPSPGAPAGAGPAPVRGAATPSEQRRSDAIAGVTSRRTLTAPRRFACTFALLAAAVAGLPACETSATIDAQNAVGQAAADVLVAHGRCASLGDCASRELLITTPSRSAAVLDVFDVEDAALALEVATACGRLVGRAPYLRRIEVQVHRPTRHRPYSRGERPWSDRGAPGWGFTFRTL